MSRTTFKKLSSLFDWKWLRQLCACVCVCVCEWEGGWVSAYVETHIWYRLNISGKGPQFEKQWSWIFFYYFICLCSSQSCSILCGPMDCSPLGSFAHEIFQARILEWGDISYSRGSSPSRYWTRVSCIASRFFTTSATWEAPFYLFSICLYLHPVPKHCRAALSIFTLCRLLSYVWKYFVDWVINVVAVQSLSLVQLLATPWTAACQAFLSFTISQSLLKFTSIESVMPSNHLILCHHLLLLPSIFPSIRVFAKETALCIRWPKYWSFSFSISPSDEYSGLIFFRMDWLGLLAVQGNLTSLL